MLVTGATRGIGLAIAEACGREGARLILVGRDRRAIERAAKSVPGGPCAVRADVTRPVNVERLFRQVRAEYGRLDVLVNNAGIFTYKPFARTTPEDWRANIESNLTSLFLVTKAALPLLACGLTPHIVNILSVASRQAFANCSAYTAAKFGALGFTRVLAEELRAQKIRVTAVLPGSTNTRMMDEFDFPVDRSSLVQPEDVARVVLGALAQPARVSVDEIVVTPSKGPL